MKPFFSIVMPVFNQEKKLQKCIETILAQTCQDFEVLIVDDGSTDRSIALIKELTNQDKKFRYIDQGHNQSVLMARKAGMLNVAGEYLLFVDIDDYLEIDMLEKLRGKLLEKPVDVLTFAFQTEPDKKVIHPVIYEDMLGELITSRIVPCVWKSAISRNLYLKSVSCIRDGYCNMAEDLYISIIFYSFAESFDVLDEVFYHYLTGGMYMGNTGRSIEKFRKQLELHDYILDCIEEFFQKHHPAYVERMPEIRTGLYQGTMWQFGGAGVTWKECFEYCLEMEKLGDEELLYWILKEFIPIRADAIHKMIDKKTT